MAGETGLVSVFGSSINQLYAARTAKEVAKYNQSLYNIQAGIIDANQKWTKLKYAETRKKELGKGIATITAQNVGMGRTSLSLLNKSMENLYLDEAMSDYNAKMSVNQAYSAGENAYIEGKSVSDAKTIGAITNASEGIATYAIKNKKVQ